MVIILLLFTCLGYRQDEQYYPFMICRKCFKPEKTMEVVNNGFGEAEFTKTALKNLIALILNF